jgi:hypothetical protein
MVDPVTDATCDGPRDDPGDSLPVRFVPHAEATIAIAAVAQTNLHTNPVILMAPPVPLDNVAPIRTCRHPEIVDLKPHPSRGATWVHARSTREPSSYAAR